MSDPIVNTAGKQLLKQAVGQCYSDPLGELMAEGGITTELVRTKVLLSVWGWNPGALACWPGNLGTSHLPVS